MFKLILIFLLNAVCLNVFADEGRLGLMKDINGTGSIVGSVRGSYAESRWGVDVLVWLTESHGNGERLETLSSCEQYDTRHSICKRTATTNYSRTVQYGIGVDYEIDITNKNQLALGAIYLDETTPLNTSHQNMTVRWSYKLHRQTFVTASLIGTSRKAWNLIGVEYRFR